MFQHGNFIDCPIVSKTSHVSAFKDPLDVQSDH